MSTNTQPTIEFYGYQRKNGHGLLTDRRLNHGEKAQRHFACKCGADFGTSFDNAATTAFRAHYSEVK